jgi:superfamily II DNA or RNA helicase
VNHAVGSLVRARGREWVVLPDTTEDLLVARPLGGTEAEVAGILTAVEDVEPATFAPPTIDDVGDHRSARLLRDALRFGVRSSAGPFRSFGDIAVEPRPYQLVPLLMALRMDIVRLLIADDVGIGKTVEAGLIAKELLTTGDAAGLAVLCPPHLAEQWQRELSQKFHLEAQLVLASTAARLERDLPVGRSIFEAHPITVVSLDFIKSDRHRDDFLRACPDLVIVDEAHTCADAAEGRGTRHQRHQLLAGLAADPDRHVVLVTATPHSGKVGAFRSLLSLLDGDFSDLADEPTQRDRQRLARHLVQRRRGDIAAYLGDTPFPERERAQESYALGPEYSELFNDVLAFARGSVQGSGDASGVHQRVRWWSALSLLRALASSPAAAAATLTTRAANAAAEDLDEVDEIGRLALFDDDTEVEGEQVDTTFGADPTRGGAQVRGGPDTALAAELRALAERADALRGDADVKVQRLAKRVRGLLKDGYHPIVFCRFVDTAAYVADELRARLPKSAAVESVTGLLPPTEREDRVATLAEQAQRVLVATDCLSEGVNLQHSFTAVIHYDLPWNPTRLEQREGRVDRFGQTAPTVRVATMVGKHVVDRIVEDVLIDKHLKIRRALGVSVPVPATSGEVLEELTNRILTAGSVEETVDQLQLDLPVLDEFDRAWQSDADREKASRTIFAQHGIHVDEVEREVAATRDALGAGDSLASFVATAVHAHEGLAVSRPGGAVHIDTTEVADALRDRLSVPNVPPAFTAGFTPPVPDGQLLLGRTHPFVAALAGYVVDTALDPKLRSAARRAGVIRTKDVDRISTVVVTRFRYQLVTRRRNRADHPMLAEDAAALGFSGQPDEPDWLDDDTVERLLAAAPSANIAPDLARDLLGDALRALPSWQEHLRERASQRASALAESHERVRSGARMAGKVEVTPTLPVDVLGVYVLLPDVTVAAVGSAP